MVSYNLIAIGDFLQTTFRLTELYVKARLVRGLTINLLRKYDKDIKIQYVGIAHHIYIMIMLIWYAFPWHDNQLPDAIDDKDIQIQYILL